MPDQDLEVMCHIAAHLKIDGPDQVASWEPDWHVNASGNLVVEWPNGRPEIVPDGPTILPPLNNDEEEYEDDSL